MPMRHRLRFDDPGLAPAPDDLDQARRHIAEAELVGPDQERVRAEVLAFCAQHADALHRRCVPGHLTGSALVVEPGTERILLIHHAKLQRWLQPGGHADGDGNLGAVAWREATEETGLDGLELVTPAIDIDIHAIPARGDDPDHLHLDLRFLVLATGSTVAAPNHEVLAARWMASDDPAVGHGELRRLVDRALTVVRRLDRPA